MELNEGKTSFTLTFSNQFTKEVQKLGPLSMRGSIAFEAKGEIPEDLQESIEVAINRTILDLAH